MTIEPSIDRDPAPVAVPEAGTEPIARLLTALQVLSLACLLLSGVSFWANAPEGLPDRAAGLVTVITITAVTGALWILRARRPSRWMCTLVTAVVALMAPVVTLLGNFAFVLPLLLLVVALAVLDLSIRAGVLVSLWLPGALLGILLVSGAPLAAALVNSLPVVVLMGFGLVLGASLRAYEQAHARDLRMLRERDDAVTQLREAMEKLRRATELEKELVLADERTRSARDLHDGLGHRLTAISMSLEFAQRMRDRDADAAWSEVAGADATAREALAEMRTWVRALSPVRDADATGIAAFEAIAESFRGTGLEVTVETLGEVDGSAGEELELGEDAHLLLYRAVQEGLTNALRHSRARRVRIIVHPTADEVELRMLNDLDDDARARIPEGPSTPGFGLHGLADRARRLGGSAHGGRDGENYVLQVRLERNRT